MKEFLGYEVSIIISLLHHLPIDIQTSIADSMRFILLPVNEDYIVPLPFKYGDLFIEVTQSMVDKMTIEFHVKIGTNEYDQDIESTYLYDRIFGDTCDCYPRFGWNNDGEVINHGLCCPFNK